MSDNRIGRWREIAVRRMRDRRGGTLVLVAGAMLGLLGMAALAVDMSAAFAWRAEAQKIADASALAGGSVFLDDLDASLVEAEAEGRAYDYALQHTIKGEPVDSSEVTVQVLTDELKVRVGINRPDMPVWFARILGFAGVDIGAVAAAQAATAGAARCLKPFAIPDMWDEAEEGADENGNRVWDPGEEWSYDENDNYNPYYDESLGGDPPLGWEQGETETGYGSDFRDPPFTNVDDDHGRRIQVKHTDPQDEYSFEPGIFFPWRLPPDPDMEECEKGGGGKQPSGAATYRKNICSCNDNPIDLGEPYDLEPGNMVGPTFQGVTELIEKDPTARWNGSLNGNRGGVERWNGEEWESVGFNSPRIVKVAVFDPGEISGSGMQSIRFNNFSLLFLEGQDSPQAPVMGRIMSFVSGEPGPSPGSLVLYLRLVE